MHISSGGDEQNTQAAGGVASMAALTGIAGPWREVGQGVLTWSVFRMYEARLLAVGDDFYPGGTFALELTYLRNLPADQIVAASALEMERLASPDAEMLADWSDVLQSVLPDVKKGDRLLGVFIAGFGVRFFNNDVLCGELPSDAFARAFASIWLSPETRSPSLRAALLGSSTQAAH
ncbi:chalcone isomerase family protein [Schauerella aestuarii]|uniref:chalcone isomerase family protein n=1 Tax=Schauerella aestuarii TaxID=2511204 RepID=UPI001369434A|nr:chalcone isomerase family protein [Achromobacter aestuarii]MYZ46057.1 hypothetical protein [Achromobacter aestuarii]